MMMKQHTIQKHYAMTISYKGDDTKVVRYATNMELIEALATLETTILQNKEYGTCIVRWGKNLQHKQQITNLPCGRMVQYK